MTNVKVRMTKPRRSSDGEGGKRFDLEERTALFGEACINFAKRVPSNPVTLPLIRQFVRASSSIGANYCEADDASSRKDVRYRSGVCQREAHETKRWLRMLVAAVPEPTADARCLWVKAKELHLIFAAIYRRRPASD